MGILRKDEPVRVDNTVAPTELPHRIRDPFLIQDEDDAEVHYWCCRPNRALCGERLDPDDADDEGEADPATLCETCRWKHAVDAPCSALFCLRRRARRRRRPR